MFTGIALLRMPAECFSWHLEPRLKTLERADHTPDCAIGDAGESMRDHHRAEARKY